MQQTVLKSFIWPLLLLLLCSCQDNVVDKPLDKVSLQLSWVHQGGFAWAYLSKDEGLFEGQGLDVNLEAGGPKVDPVSALLEGRAQFGILATELLLKNRQEGKPLVLLAMIYQRSPVTFISLKKSGLESPKDFVGKKVTFAALEDKVQFLAMMGRLGLKPDIEIHPYSYKYAGLLDGSVDISGAYTNGGVLRLQRSGVELNVCWPYDYGIRFYGQALVATEDFVKNNSELSQKMVAATLEGLKKNLVDPEVAVIATMKYAKEQDEELQAAMIRASLPLLGPGDVAIGSIDPLKLKAMNKILYEQGYLADPDIWEESYLPLLPAKVK